jgi:diguanylate cyclase (GGDEF)-like protein
VKSRKNNIPEVVYVEFVRSLFDSAHMVAVGAACHALVAYLSYWHSGDQIYLVFSATLLAAGLWRYFTMRGVARGGVISNGACARTWEQDYIVKGSVQGLLLGLFCFYAIYLRPSSFAEIGAVSVTLGSMVTVVGRNYGSPRMVHIFAATFVGPISLGLIMRGGLPYVALGLLIVPFHLIIVGSASRIRDVLFSAVTGHKRANQLAQRFNRALNTMSHGLIMLDSDGRIAVANAEAGQLMSTAPSRLLGRSVKSLMMRGVAGGLLTPKDSRYAEAQLTRALREGRDRKVLISFNNGRHYEFSAREGRDEIGVITFEDVTARIEAEEKIRYMACFDGLTGLPNRAHFHETLAELMAVGDRSRLCGLVILDLDDFKTINDTLGHPVGDGLIYAVAQRLSAFADDEIKISRFGGDEFMAYVDWLADDAQFEQLLERIFASFQEEADVAGHALRIQASAGAVVCKVDETDVDGMFVKADLALYKAKEQGKNGWQLFQPKMDADFRNKQLLKADLRSAVEAHALRVVYQPIVAMDTMRIASCEALCRWDHTELGPISPAVFIPLAEEMGIISEISRFMLAAACAECTRWPEQIRVSINLSARDFRNRDIVQIVREALADSGLAPNRLEIEVTETALLDDKSSTRKFLEELKAIGVRIALDDFGTGYSSLSYLHTLPLDRVKIDRSFLIDVTRNERSLELLRGIVNLSRPLGLSVTVEGVETFEQLKVLALDVKPDLVQGFLFGSALTASGILTMSKTVWPFAEDITSAGATTPRRTAENG